jgi:hypothetical protein
MHQLIKDTFTKHNINFEFSGQEFSILCPFKPEGSPTGSYKLLTFNIDDESGMGYCAYCHRVTNFDELCEALSIPAPIPPSEPKVPRGAKIPLNNDSFNESQPEPEQEPDPKEPEKQKEEPIIDVSNFKPMTPDQLIETLSLTIKHDEENKLITFLAALSAYTENSQLNVSFNAPSSTGKSYIPTEIAQLFPKEDVMEVGYCSPTAFFHDKGEYEKLRNVYIMDLSRKILIFLDQPHSDLLKKMRPVLSHDKKEIVLKVTDKNQRFGLKTKNVLLRGFPSVIFCTAGLKIDEQESTRFLLLSPETSSKKIQEAIQEKITKEADQKSYYAALEENPLRQHLKERIRAIRQAKVSDIDIENPSKIKEIFFEAHKNLKPRHQRDVGRIISLIKAFALLNSWFREKKGDTIIANNDDIDAAFKIWNAISEPQEHNLPPYIYQLYKNVILPAAAEKNKDNADEQHRLGLSRREITQTYLQTYKRVLPDWLLRQQIIPMLENAGLIHQEPDPEDKRKVLIYPTGSLDIPPIQNNSESQGGANAAEKQDTKTRIVG